MANMKSVTLRIPEPVHRKLRMLAASKGITMTDMLIALIEDARLDSQAEVATVRSLLYGATVGEPDQNPNKDQQSDGPTAETKAILQARKRSRKVDI